MRLTIPTIAITTASFAATLAFAPAIAQVAEQFVFSQSQTVKISMPANEELRCPPVAKILAALRGTECM
jgi:hypothetical protein